MSDHPFIRGFAKTFLKDALSKEAEIIKASPRKGATPKPNVPDNLFI